MTTTKRVLVLDTNLVLGAPVVVLQALADRGFALSASVIALEERLARASREGIEALRTRLRNISGYIDPANPIMPQGAPLYARLGIDDPDPAKKRDTDAYNVSLLQLWGNLVETEELRDWKPLASGMKESINRNAGLLRKQLATFRGVPKDGVTYDMVLTETKKIFSDHPVVKKFGQFRLDAYVSRLAKIIFEAPEQPPENDVEDVALLEHLVEDVILVTGDYKSIVALDATRSFQAPFVRSAWEILDGIVPDGPPWGPSAMEAWGVHASRTRRSLSDLERAVRCRLGPSSKRAKQFAR